MPKSVWVQICAIIWHDGKLSWSNCVFLGLFIVGRLLLVEDMDWQIRLIIWQFDHLMDWSSDRWEGKPSKFGFFCQMLKTASDRDGWFWHRVVSSLYQEWSDVISRFRALTFQVTLMTILLHVITGKLVLDSDLWKSRWGKEAPKCQNSQLVFMWGSRRCSRRRRFWRCWEGSGSGRGFMKG